MPLLVKLGYQSYFVVPDESAQDFMRVLVTMTPVELKDEYSKHPIITPSEQPCYEIKPISQSALAFEDNSEATVAAIERLSKQLGEANSEKYRVMRERDDLKKKAKETEAANA